MDCVVTAAEMSCPVQAMLVVEGILHLKASQQNCTGVSGNAP